MPAGSATCCRFIRRPIPRWPEWRAGSPADPRFNPVETVNELPTFGVEEEFLLADPHTGEPVPENKAVADEAGRRGITLQRELSSCQVETTSGGMATSTALRDDLVQRRRVAAEAAEACG